ncbi:Acetylcholine receptor subunit beta [Intoshia linei]|uniref:Acetylcholine receptor subunit beta n=1 Tax=Intoshia linei TaxID=1819745 RepID=A0A177ATJ4_9BILA|nr:Acetylcholine receptor subunit beta [Intoshia linei]
MLINNNLIFYALALIHLICHINGSVESVTLSHEQRLIKYLLEHYAKIGVIGRPVYNTTDTVQVYYGLALVQILDLDEKNQVLTTNAWSRYQWNDLLLKWDPKDYANIEEVRIPVQKLWRPDIILYNYADDRLTEHREAMAKVTSDGTVLWIPMAIYKSTCIIDITNFPFDVQTCHLKFGSWTYDGASLNINFYNNASSVDMTDYTTSNEWKILETPAVRNEKRYPCCEEVFPDLTFYIKLQRVAEFYSFILVLPSVLLSSLTLVVFWLPPDSPAKMVLGINVFLAFFVLLLLLADSIPPATEKIPLIGAYFALNMILITLSSFLSVIIINIYYRGDNDARVPYILRKIFINFLAKILLVSGREDIMKYCQKDLKARSHIEQALLDTEVKTKDEPNYSFNKSINTNEKKCKIVDENYLYTFKNKTVYTESSKIGEKVTPSAAVSPFSYKRNDTNEKNNTETTCEDNHIKNLINNSDHRYLNSMAPDICHDMREICYTMKSLVNRMNNKDKCSKVVFEWRMVGYVLDRIFFLGYIVTITVSLWTIFPKP